MGKSKSSKPLEPKDNWKKQFRTEVIDHKNVHFCKSCEFNTTIQKDMEYHVRKHLKNEFPYPCGQLNCEKAFKTNLALNEHLIHHKCGFGIEGMEEIGICGKEQIKQHYEMIVDNNQFKYVCNWKGCKYIIKQVDRIEKHVHAVHVCPHKAKYSTPSAARLV